MRTSLRLITISLSLATLFLTACGGNGDNSGKQQSGESSGLEIHPRSSRLPHKDTTPVAIGMDAACAYTPAHEPLRLLMEALGDDPRPLVEQQIDVPVGDHNWVDVASLDENAVLVLNRFQSAQELWKYDIGTEISTRLAGRGQGPGDLMFPMDMVVDDGRIHVALADRRIATFDCNSGDCSHEQDVRVEFQPMGLARMQGGFASVGTVPLQGAGTDPLPSAVQVIDEGGNVIESFGEPYDTPHWMVSEQFVRNASIASYPGVWLALSYGDIPVIYIYDRNGRLESAARIEDFSQGTFTYQDGHRSIFRKEDFSRIVKLRVLDQEHLIVTAKTTIRSAPESDANNTLHAFDYYLISRDMECARHLGRDEAATSDGGREWVVTDHHLLRIREGYVHVVDAG